LTGKRARMFLLLQRYLVRDLVRVVTLTLVGATAVLVLLPMGQAMAQARVPAIHVLKALPIFVPVVVAYVAPATILFAATLVYGRFAHDNEFDAVRMSGIHPLVVVLPAVVLGAVLSAGVVYCAGELLPRSLYQMSNLDKNIDVVEDMFFAQLREQGYWKANNVVITVGSVDRPAAHDVRIEQYRDGQREMTLTAETVAFGFDPATREVELTVRDARVETYNAQSAQARIEHLKQLRYPLPPSRLPKPREEAMSVLIRTLAREDDANGATTRRTRAQRRVDQAERRDMLSEVHYRLNLAVSCLTLVLVAVPLATHFRRGHLLSAFLVALGPMLLFHVVTFTAKNLVVSGSVPAGAVWTGNGLLAFLGLVLLRRMFRR
jgi:lipopolysaccharide export LptBFGC system permease protein LptF